MRIPLIRSPRNPTPIAWWEWLFAPLIIPLEWLLLGVLALGSILLFPVLLWQRNRILNTERETRQRLNDAGRFINWADIESMWRAGEGTVIVEIQSFQKLPPDREWWTEDDLIADSPVRLPPLQHGWPEGEYEQTVGEYAKQILTEYLNTDFGEAKLTAIPAHLNGNMSDTMPEGNIVTLFSCAEPPMIFLGERWR